MQTLLNFHLRSVMKLMPAMATRPADAAGSVMGAAFVATATAMVVTDLDWRIVAANPAYAAMMGQDGARLLGTVLSCETAGGAALPGGSGQFDAGSPLSHWEGEVVAVDGHGKRHNHWMVMARVNEAPGRGPMRVITFTDISVLAQERAILQHDALHDPLTGLPNRRLFDEGMARSLARAIRQGQPLALLLVDIDHFKGINDAHGHAMGDAVLREIGARLRRAVRAEDLVARLGGDEFAVLLENVARTADAASTAATLLAAIGRGWEGEGMTLKLSASIGIAMFPDDAATAATLVSRADAAMYLAKTRGRACFALAGQAWPQVAGPGR